MESTRRSSTANLTGRVEGRGGYVSQSKVKAETNNDCCGFFITSIQKTLYFVGAYYMLGFLGVSQLEPFSSPFPPPHPGLTKPTQVP